MNILNKFKRKNSSKTIKSSALAKLFYDIKVCNHLEREVSDCDTIEDLMIVFSKIMGCIRDYSISSRTISILLNIVEKKGTKLKRSQLNERNQ